MNKDSLTGLYGEDYFRSTYGSYLEKNSDAKLISIDLTKFKYINDNFGHDAGDLCLKLFAYILEHLFGENSVCVRLHGDEFLILTNDNNEVIEKKFKEINRLIANSFDGKKRKIAVVFGFNAGIVTAEHDINNTIDKADITMEYGAKKKRKQFAYYSDAIYNKAKEEGFFVKNFSDDISRNDIFHVAQQICDFNGDSLGISDVYSRILTTNNDLVSPFNGRKLELLASSCTLKKLDYHNLRNLLRHESVDNGDNMIINIHHQTLLNQASGAFENLIRKLVHDKGVDPSRFAFCIDVHTLGNEWREILDGIRFLKAMGFTIMLGGYDLRFNNPTINLWSQLNIDFIKVDRSSWYPAESNIKNELLLKNVSSMLVDSGTIPIFMKVESIDEVELLKEINCHGTTIGYVNGKVKKLKRHR